MASVLNFLIGGEIPVQAFFERWNRLKLRLCGAKINNYCKIYNKLYLFLHPKGSLEIGKNFTFSTGSNFNQLSWNIRGAIYVASGATMKIGDSVGVSSSCLWCTKQITIGNHVDIGADTLILDTDAHHLNWQERRNGGERSSKPVIIEDDVFIGIRSIILKGVTIGARSLIGAGSVVAKRVTPDCVAAGNPCKIIRMNNQ